MDNQLGMAHMLQFQRRGGRIGKGLYVEILESKEEVTEQQYYS